MLIAPSMMTLNLDAVKGATIRASDRVASIHPAPSMAHPRPLGSHPHDGPDFSIIVLVRTKSSHSDASLPDYPP